MKNLIFGITAIASFLIIGCNRNENEFDASGFIRDARKDLVI
jgi:hypothetical protein